MDKKKLIIVSTFFPPKNHIASRRIYAFAKYLAEYYDVTVLTSTEGNDYVKEYKNFKVIYISKGYTEHFVSLKNKEKKTIRLSKLVIRKTLLSLNIGFHPIWKIKAIQKLRSILENDEVSYILSSYMPIEAHEVCYKTLLSSSKFDDIFWIADMRDEMSELPSLREHQRKHYRKLESKYSKRINLVTSVSKPILDQFRDNMSDRQDFLEIKNGYDHNISPNHNYTEKLRLGYFGSFYGKIKPDNFFKALSKCDFLDDVEVYIASSNNNYKIPHELVRNIKQIDFMPYEDSIKTMGTMDCNILILPFVDTRVGVYSGKLFDYISTTRPILGLVNKNDVAANLIKDLNCGYLADPNNIDDIAQALIDVYTDWKSKSMKEADKKQTHSLHRKEQVRLLSSYLQIKALG